MRNLGMMLTAVLLFAACAPGQSQSSGDEDGEMKNIAAISADGPFVKADDPAAPGGWTAQPGVTATKYQDNANPLNVFRLFQPAQTDQPIEDWFEGRRRTLPTGIDKPRFVEELIIESGFYTGYARAEQAGAPVAVISYACKSGGGIRYGELITSQDDAIAQPAAAATLKMTIDLCRESIAETAAANPATAPDNSAGAATPQRAAAPVEPGRALQSRDIEAVVYTWEETYVGADYKVISDLYLLMKDGTARRNLPSEAPANFDLVADRLSHRNAWVKWRKRGGDYEFQSASGGPWQQPPKQEARRGGKKGLRLNGSFEAADSSSSMTVSSWSQWGLRLNADGTFRRSSSSGAGGTMGSGDNAISTSATQNDKGGEYAAPVPSGGGSSSTGITDADLTGNYQIDPYTLTLTYKNGRTTRSFFYISENGRHIWFEGRDLFLQE